MAHHEEPSPMRYGVGEQLGKGGMGEVLLATDPMFGREVALKRMFAGASKSAEARFVREAKIQALLQHPAIVPVHDLGRDADGRSYFTMDRLGGVTLERLLELRTPRQKLLRAFRDVCLAVDFAHSKSVLHRDLKPANVMLGDFGEVYVIDWGVARVLADHDAPPVSLSLLGDDTLAGVVIGTPGYMAPEQCLGKDVRTPADVYALGAILFEILVGEPLHSGEVSALSSTLTRPTQSPSGRRPDVTTPPELEALCVEALAVDPDSRPSARDLADRIERYLDGDRDMERRRALARDQLLIARDAFASAYPTARAEAVQAAGRALALDPESREAADLVTSLLVEPPEKLPPELLETLEASARAESRTFGKKAMLALAVVVPFAATMALFEVRSWPLLIAFWGTIAAVMASLLLAFRRGKTTAWVALGVNFAMLVLASRVASPFVITPVLTCGVLIGVTTGSWVRERPSVVVAWTLAVVLLPLALESVGLFEPTWWFADGRLVIRSAIVEGFPSVVDHVALLAANALLIVALGLFTGAMSRGRYAAERRLQIQAWHLRQLLPKAKG